MIRYRSYRRSAQKALRRFVVNAAGLVAAVAVVAGPVALWDAFPPGQAASAPVKSEISSASNMPEPWKIALVCVSLAGLAILGVRRDR